jgi:predicted CXXCH cytochrome family protein
LSTIATVGQIKTALERKTKRRVRMKSRVLLAVTLLVGLAASAQAATIAGTKHDLSSAISSANSVHSTTQNQTCAFCHAPHNASTNKLLWSRTAIAGTMSIYTSYNTGAMRLALTQSTLGSDSSSLLCLSCHSLATAADVINGTANSKGGTPAAYSGSTFPSLTGNMNNLTNDHPVGINYDSAVAPSAGGLIASTSGTVVGLGGAAGGTGTVRLFKSAVSGTSTMECASCHSVHDNANGKFLAVQNSQSNLCRICHVK